MQQNKEHLPGVEQSPATHDSGTVHQSETLHQTYLFEEISEMVTLRRKGKERTKHSPSPGGIRVHGDNMRAGTILPSTTLTLIILSVCL